MMFYSDKFTETHYLNRESIARSTWYYHKVIHSKSIVTLNMKMVPNAQFEDFEIITRHG